MELYTLETLSERLGGIPLSTLKHRIAQLGIPATARGSRNKLLFDERAAALIEASDQLLKQGNGLTTTRRMLGLEEDAPAQDGVPELVVEVAASGPTPDAYARLSEALAHAIAQIEAKDRQINLLQEELRRTTESAAAFQQKTFYLQQETQRLQEELKEALRQVAAPKGWKGLFKP